MEGSGIPTVNNPKEKLMSEKEMDPRRTKFISESRLKEVQISSRPFFDMWENVFSHERQAYEESLKGIPETPSGLLFLRVFLLNSGFHPFLLSRSHQPCHGNLIN